MAIPDYARANFETLMKAAKAGDLALMECTEVGSGETRYVLCAVGRDDGRAHLHRRPAAAGPVAFRWRMRVACLGSPP